MQNLEPEKLANKIKKWKKNGIEYAVNVESTSQVIVPGVVYIQHRDQKTRIQYALKTIGIFWGMAIAAVLIPILHFILVPSLIIAGPIVAFFIYQQENIVLGGISTCPSCKKPMEIVKGEEEWPLKDVCGVCFQTVQIQKIDHSKSTSGV